MVAYMTDGMLTELDRLRRKDDLWIQIDVAAPGASASTIAEAVARVVGELNALGVGSPEGGRVGRWWFVRKHPGVRVRIEVPSIDEAWRAAARSALSRLGPAAVSVYEAERYRFGGDQGMNVAHDEFALDSSLAVLRERVHVRPMHWSAWLLDDLCWRLVDDAAEAWDAWKRLEEVIGSVAGKRIDHVSLRMAADEERALWHVKSAADHGHGIVAERLRQASLEHGVGLRSWFGAAAVFHWNRLGLQPVEIQQVVSEVLSRFDSR
jgi:thiopeptide-type bacteriocin biosynthesis protein